MSKTIYLHNVEGILEGFEIQAHLVMDRIKYAISTMQQKEFTIEEFVMGWDTFIDFKDLFKIEVACMNTLAICGIPVKVEETGMEGTMVLHTKQGYILPIVVTNTMREWRTI